MEFTSSEPDHLPIVDFKPESTTTERGNDVIAEAKFPLNDKLKVKEISGFRTGDICFL